MALGFNEGPAAPPAALRLVPAASTFAATTLAMLTPVSQQRRAGECPVCTEENVAVGAVGCGADPEHVACLSCVLCKCSGSFDPFGRQLSALARGRASRRRGDCRGRCV